MSLEFVTTDFEKVTYLVNLLTARATGEMASNDDYEQLRSGLLQKPELRELLPPWLRTNSNLGSFWPFIKGKYGSYADRRKFLSDEFEEVLNVLEFGHTVEFEKNTAKAVAPPWSSLPAKKKGKIFLVHGRDNESKQEVARYVESLNIGAIILHEQASSGRTIIEKIEHYANEADFAIVLYTACDHGRGIDETKVHPKNRARQNVVFEHGYLMAKLGRKNVCALVKGEIETPNDISGVVYVELDEGGAWKTKINKELKACGYTITI
tara:strand:- start:247 stop:1044 length:798 start_codon:yes stop_codon:yes gene_type:complete